MICQMNQFGKMKVIIGEPGSYNHYTEIIVGDWYYYEGYWYHGFKKEYKKF